MNEQNPATIFVTARWIHHNKASLALLESRPDLFRIENHGEKHIPAVDRPSRSMASPRPVHLKPWPRRSRVARPRSWPTARRHPDGSVAPPARYSRSAISEIEHMGYALPANRSTETAARSCRPPRRKNASPTPRMATSIIAHINQPTHAAGEGVVRGILALKARGAVFEHLDEPEVMAGGMR